MSFDKTVKNACKPKKDVPKAKVRFVRPTPPYTMLFTIYLVGLSVVWFDVLTSFLFLFLLRSFLCLVGMFSSSCSPWSLASDYLNHPTPLHSTPQTISHHTTPHHTPHPTTLFHIACTNTSLPGGKNST